ncbi:MAG: cohesin domain-containing protein [Patescibacteria group bacterium]
MQKSNSKIKIQKFLIIILLFLTATPVLAAEISFKTKTNEIQVGKQFEVEIFINTPEESVNAFEGKIIFPTDLLRLKEIKDGNSIINFWINRPKLERDTIVFSGITPGGFQGTSGLLFSVIFEAKSEGIANFKINEARVLRNDGQGSLAILTIRPFEMRISSIVSNSIPTVRVIKDFEPPETFLPEIAKNELIFGGKWFVAFATQDKASGIDHYEIKESRQKILSLFKKWIWAESPYLLRDQKLHSFIWIKAVDKAGNKRIVKISPRYPLSWYKNYENWVIIIIMVIFLVAVILAIKKRKRDKIENSKF